MQVTSMTENVSHGTKLLITSDWECKSRNKTINHELPNSTTNEWESSINLIRL